ncbi:MAG: FKBP-type peptidyl-prolyl cis-trans isomerase [Lentimonas sp.]
MIKLNHLSSIALLALVSSSVTYAQDEAAGTAVEPSAPEVSEAELLEMLGYLTVLQSGMKELGFTVEDAPAIAKGVEKALADDQPDQVFMAKMPAFQTFIQGRMDVAQARMEEAQAAAAKDAELAAADNIEAGKAFIAKLKGEEGIEFTESGLHYRVIEPGEGDKPTMSDSVLVHYRGTLIDGTEFDSSYKRGQPATFPLNGVVPGFGEGLTKVAPGGKITLYIPSDLGYGNNPRPGGAIKPGDTLVFECELIEVNP